MKCIFSPQQYQAHHRRFVGFPTLLLYPSLALQSQDHDLGCSFIFPLAFCSGLVTGFPFPSPFHGAILCAPVPVE